MAVSDSRKTSSAVMYRAAVADRCLSNASAFNTRRRRRDYDLLDPQEYPRAFATLIEGAALDLDAGISTDVPPLANLDWYGCLLCMCLSGLPSGVYPGSPCAWGSYRRSYRWVHLFASFHLCCADALQKYPA